MKTLIRFLIMWICSLAGANMSIAQWVQVIGSYSGIIYCFTVRDSNIFAGTNAGVYLSTDGGLNWSAVNNGLTNTTEVESLPFIGTDLFAGTWTGGVFLSTNNGSKWTAVNKGLTHTMVGALVVKSDGAGDTDLFAGTWAGGVFLSTNKGSSWTTVNNRLTDNNVVSLIVSDTNLFAGTTSGVFLSSDNGSSWSLANNGLTFIVGPDQPDTASVISHLAVGTSGASGTNLFAATWGGGVFLSIDNGSNWSAINNGLPDNQITLSISSLTVSGSNLFIGTSDGGMYVSTNNGASWTSVDTGLTGSSVQVIAIIGTNVFAGTNNGIWRRPISEMVTGVKDNTKQTPTHFALEQNYPNPFNPTTSINYQLPMTSLVLLKVYDVLGREVKTLVSERQNAGNHSAAFDASKLPSGVYFYRLQAGSFNETKKLVLLK